VAAHALALFAAISASVSLGGCDGSSARNTVATCFSERDAIEIRSALEQSGIRGVQTSEQTSGGKPAWIVSVPPAFAPFADVALTELALPRTSPPGFDALVASGGLIPTRADDDARLWAAWSGEVARLVQVLAGVAEVRALVTLPRREPSGSAFLNVIIPDEGEQAPSVAVVVRRVDTASRDSRGAAVDSLTREQLLDDALAAEVRATVQQAWAGIEERLKRSGGSGGNGTRTNVAPQVHVVVSHRLGPLYSPAAKTALAQALKDHPKAFDYHLSFMTRVVVPLLTLSAGGVLLWLTIRSRLRA